MGTTPRYRMVWRAFGVLLRALLGYKRELDAYPYLLAVKYDEDNDDDRVVK